MTSIFKAYWTAVHRQVAQYQLDVQRALLKGFDVLAKGMSERELAAFLSRGGVDRFILDVVPEDKLVKAFGPMRQRLQTAIKGSAENTTKLLPSGVAAAEIVAFDILNPKVIDAIKDLDTRVFTKLTDTVRESVREHVTLGLKDGLAPTDIARDIRGAVGLAPNQVRAVRNFEKMLRNGDATALTRELRDRRFDGTLKRLFAGNGGLSEAQISKMVGQYEKRFIAFHAETIARTATLDAVKLGQRLTWEGAINAGAVDARSMMKRWVGVKDDREREEHLAMEGETVPYDQPFSNGDDIPGENDYNCRCIAYYFPDTTDVLVPRKDETTEAFGDRAAGVIGTIRGVLETSAGGTIEEITGQLTGYFPEKETKGLMSTVRTQVSRLAKTTGREIISVVEPGRGRVYRFIGQPLPPRVEPPVLPPVVVEVPVSAVQMEVAEITPTITQLQQLENSALAKTYKDHPEGRAIWSKLSDKEKLGLDRLGITYRRYEEEGNYGTFFSTGIDARVRRKAPVITVSPTHAKWAESNATDSFAKKMREHAIGTAYHETGHAMDWVFGSYRKSATARAGHVFWSTSGQGRYFRDAVMADLQSGSITIKRYREYLVRAYKLPLEEALRDGATQMPYNIAHTLSVEVFADLYSAIRYGSLIRGGITGSTEEFIRAFPKAAKYIRKILERFEAA